MRNTNTVIQSAKEDQPLVSVIIPAYNPGLLILETISSVIDQTYRPLEIIVVDDGSTDNFVELLDSYRKKGEVSYIRQKNQGQDAARKTGLRASRGVFISFVDADDLIAPNKIALQAEQFKNDPECGACYSDILHFWHHQPEVLLRKKLSYHSGYIFDKLIRENFIQVMTALIRRDLLEKYWVNEPAFPRSDDWFLWLCLSFAGAKFCFLNNVLSFQRRQKKGTLSDQTTYFKETAEVNLAIYELFRKRLSDDEARKYDIAGSMNFWKFRLAVGYAIVGDKKNAFATIREYRVKSLSDAIKKTAFFSALFFVPVSLLSKAILFAREVFKRRSFTPVEKKDINLPAILRKAMRAGLPGRRR